MKNKQLNYRQKKYLLKFDRRIYKKSSCKQTENISVAPDDASLDSPPGLEIDRDYRLLYTGDPTQGELILKFYSLLGLSLMESFRKNTHTHTAAVSHSAGAAFTGLIASEIDKLTRFSTLMSFRIKIT